MARPTYVQDALRCEPDQSVCGLYKDLVLKPAYQPIYEPRARDAFSLNAVEGLVRAFRNENPVSPNELFSTVDEDDRLFVECMCTALHIRNFHKLGKTNLRLFINVDVSKFPTIDVLEREFYFIFSQLSKHGLDSRRLVFEIIETEVLDISVLKRVCELFKNNGFTFALDDFGSKSSNLDRYFQVFPDIVKLDRSLFRGFVDNLKTRELLDSLVTAFQNNGSLVLLEGAETADELLMASDMDISLFQGFALGKPQLLPLDFLDEIMVRPAADGSVELVEQLDEFVY